MALIAISPKESSTPMTTPYTVPKNNTPRKAIIKTTNSVLLVFKSFFAVFISSMPISAVMTMPVRTGTGRYFIRGVPKSSTSTMVMDAVTDITWERTLEVSAIPLLETLPFIGHAPVKAPARFMAPYAKSSALLSSLS